MTGYIPVPPEPWVPTATDSDSKLFPAATMDALDEHNDGRYATTEQGEKADEAVPNTVEGRTALAASPELGAAIAQVGAEHFSPKGFSREPSRPRTSGARSCCGVKKSLPGSSVWAHTGAFAHSRG